MKLLCQTGSTVCRIVLFTILITAATANHAVAEAGVPQTPPPISGRNLSNPETILPADVLSRIELIRANLELVRQHMGKATGSVPVLRVSEAGSEEVYSQALNLEKRANKFAHEQLGMYRAPDPIPSGDVRPYGVFLIMDDVLQSVLAVKAKLGVEATPVEKNQSPDTSIAEVFNAAIAAGSELNNLLKIESDPEYVLQAIVEAVSIASYLHYFELDSANLPSSPEFEPLKSPDDVFARMLRCFELVTVLADRRDINTLKLDISSAQSKDIQPDDSSNLAFLLLVKLNDIYEHTPTTMEYPHVYAPGEISAAHVYQRVGLLERILNNLVVQ